MRNHENHVMLTRYEAVDVLFENWDFVPETEEVSLDEAYGRVLAADVFAKHNLPSMPTSQMDGIAVHFDSFIDGVPDVTKWEFGKDFKFCNTGVAMPDGFDTSIAIECVEVGENNTLLSLARAPQHCGASVNPVGAAMKEGELLVEAGTCLTPTHVSLVAQGGNLSVSVIKKPVVAFIPTGNELVDATDKLPAGKNIESNSFILRGMLENWGANPSVFSIIPDDRDQLTAALKKAAAEADIVVINAGSSKGSDDWTCEILEEKGEILFHETDNAPGRHCSGAILDGKPVVGISGPPMGAEFTVEWFVKPLVDKYLYGRTVQPPVMYAYLDAPIEKRGPKGVNMVKRVTLRRDSQGYLWAHVLPMNAPVLKDCAKAQGYLVLDKDSLGFNQGDLVEIELRFPYSIVGI